ncbi:MAG: PIN domain-containing protein [Thermoanaerobaculia bacterium]
MDRVFLDANILFSAAWREDSGLTRLWKLKQIVLLTSTYAFEEAYRNLPNPQQRERLRHLTAGMEIVEVSTAEGPLADEVDLPANDLPILAAAIATAATHLLTGDRRAFGRYYGKTLSGVQILRPASYLETK